MKDEICCHLREGELGTTFIQARASSPRFHFHIGAEVLNVIKKIKYGFCMSLKEEGNHS